MAGLVGAGIGNLCHMETSTCIQVDRPVSTVYDQWKKFETFPKFMKGVEEVRRVGNGRLHWKARIAGVSREWDAVITNDEPDRCIAWASTEGATNNGTVRFRDLGQNRTEVEFCLAFDPDDPVEWLGDSLGIIERRAEQDLHAFKEYVEHDGHTPGDRPATDTNEGDMS